LYEITGKQVKDVFVAPSRQNTPNANQEATHHFNNFFWFNLK